MAKSFQYSAIASQILMHIRGYLTVATLFNKSSYFTDQHCSGVLGEHRETQGCAAGDAERQPEEREAGEAAERTAAE